MKRILVTVVALAITTTVILTSGCGETASTLPALTAADLNTEAPCPNQDLLTSTQFVADIQAATAFSFFYVNGTNATFCGFDDNFSVTGETEVQVTQFSGYDLNALLTGGVGLCGTDGGQNSLPLAGVYRKDGKFTANGRTYRVRVRVTIAAGDPDILGATLASEGITNLETNLKYEINGTEVTEDETFFTNVTAAMPSATITVKKASDDSTVLTATVEVICAQDITT